MSDNEKKEIECGKCGGKIFWARSNYYDVFEAVGAKLVDLGSVLTDGPIDTFCKNCGTDFASEGVDIESA